MAKKTYCEYCGKKEYIHRMKFCYEISKYGNEHEALCKPCYRLLTKKNNLVTQYLAKHRQMPPTRHIYVPGFPCPHIDWWT